MSKTTPYRLKADKTKEAASLAMLSGEQLEHRRAEVNTAIKSACDYLNSDGVDPRNYVEQLAWMFFLKAFDEAEAVRADVAEFDDKMVENRLPDELRWSTWSKQTGPTKC
jgi:type I restriction enzyme M protein